MATEVLQAIPFIVLPAQLVSYNAGSLYVLMYAALGCSRFVTSGMGNWQRRSGATSASDAGRSPQMIRLAVGIVIGYVLGTKAGRERYDQIMRLSSKATHSPAVQGAAGFVTAKVTNLLPGRKYEPRRPDQAYFPDNGDANL